jgi:hypothetical protein
MPEHQPTRHKTHKTHKIKHGDDPRRIITGDPGPKTQPVKQQEKDKRARGGKVLYGRGTEPLADSRVDADRAKLGLPSLTPAGFKMPGRGMRRGGPVSTPADIYQRAQFGNLSQREAAQAQQLFGRGGGGGGDGGGVSTMAQPMGSSALSGIPASAVDTSANPSKYTGAPTPEGMQRGGTVVAPPRLRPIATREYGKTKR